MPSKTDAGAPVHCKAVEAWVGQDLSNRYDRVLAETIPSSLIDLLRDR